MSDQLRAVSLLMAAVSALPIRRGPVRFAVGSPQGFTSNAWRVWTSKHGDVYISCRDNFKEAKVSLHTSGRWRMGFTTEAISKNAGLLSEPTNRAWDVWDQPLPSLPGIVTAFHLVFPTSELVVRPEQRPNDQWKHVVFIEAAPMRQMVNVTLFVTVGAPALQPEYGRSCPLASLAISDGRYAQLVAYHAPEVNIPDIIKKWSTGACAKAKAAQIELLPEAFGYVLGRRDDGSRFIVGARVFC